MARYIDADALIDDIKNNLWDWDTVDGIKAQTVLRQTITDIGNAPTVDAVPVVRCKDCKFSNWYTGGDGRPYNYCTELERGGFEEADYCSFGERKDDE